MRNHGEDVSWSDHTSRCGSEGGDDQIHHGIISLTEHVSNRIALRGIQVQLNDSLGKLSRFLESHNYVIIKFAHDHCELDSSRSTGGNHNASSLAPLSLDQDQGSRQSKTHIFGIITSIDLLEFIVKHNKKTETVAPVSNGFHAAKENGSEIANETEALK